MFDSNNTVFLPPNVHQRSGAYPAPCRSAGVNFTWDKQPEREAEYSPPSRAGVENEWCSISAPPMWRQSVSETTLPLPWTDTTSLYWCLATGCLLGGLRKGWILLRSSLFYDVTQRWLAVNYRQFGTTSQLMLYRDIIAVCSEIHKKYINTLCGQNAELLDVKLVVQIVTTGLKRVKSLL
jgi:hypothetical protein